MHIFNVIYLYTLTYTSASSNGKTNIEGGVEVGGCEKKKKQIGDIKIAI